MSSSSKRFTRLEKSCVFLIVMGKDRAREILADMDIDLIQKINATMISLGHVTALENATIMIELGDFFHKDAPALSVLVILYEISNFFCLTLSLRLFVFILLTLPLNREPPNPNAPKL